MALRVGSEGELMKLATALLRAGLPHHISYEDDAPYSGQAMALGVIGERSALKRHMRKLKLFS